jgi:hypothetical protein
MSAEEKRSGVVEFVRQHANTWLKLDLLCFWGKYPYARFSVGIIARALGCKRRVDVEEALDSLLRDNLVERHTNNGLPFYCLTRDPAKRECVLNLPAYRNHLRPTLSMG